MVIGQPPASNNSQLGGMSGCKPPPDINHLLITGSNPPGRIVIDAGRLERTRSGPAPRDRKKLCFFVLSGAFCQTVIRSKVVVGNVLKVSGKMQNHLIVRYTKFRDDRPMHSRVIFGKPKEIASPSPLPPCAGDGKHSSFFTPNLVTYHYRNVVSINIYR